MGCDQRRAAAPEMRAAEFTSQLVRLIACEFYGPHPGQRPASPAALVAPVVSRSIAFCFVFSCFRGWLFPRAPLLPCAVPMHRSGRHFLQIPGPTNVPDRILRAMAQPTIDHRGPEFAALGREVLEGVRAVFKTSGPVVIFPSSGTGAWEAALINTLSPGDKVLAFENGEFSRLWTEMARRLGLDVDVVLTDWTRGVDPVVLESK